MAEWWNSAEDLSKLARWVPYLFIFLGFVIAGLGQWAKTQFDSRIAILREKEESTRKNTPPSVEVKLGRGSSGKILLEILAENKVPFRADWLLVTKSNRVVSPIMIEKPEFFPTEEKPRFLYPVTINDEKVVDNYIELRFKFESLYSAELNHPDHLKGEITAKYRYVDGIIYHWRDTL